MSKMTVEKSSDRDGIIFILHTPGFSFDGIAVVSEDYARRIAACWNVFQGVRTADIERVMPTPLGWAVIK